MSDGVRWAWRPQEGPSSTGKADSVLGKWALKEKRQGFNHM
jgi:hypothetical protein